MIIRNDIITEANLIQKSFIGNRLALDTFNPTSYPGSGNKWYDLSGNNNTITLYGNPTFTENSLYFNGSDQWGQRTSTPSLNIEGPKISMEMWVKIDSFVEGVCFLLSKVPYNGAPSNENGNYMFWYFPSVISFSSNGNGSQQNVLRTEGSYTTLDNWVQVVYTYDNPTCKFYVNGSFVVDLTSGGFPEYGYHDLYKNAQDLYIGRRADAAPFLNGNIAVVNLFDYALTEDQILYNYNYYSPRFA